MWWVARLVSMGRSSVTAHTVRVNSLDTPCENPAVRTLLRRTFKLGIVAGLGYAAWRWFDGRRRATDTGVEWRAAPFPFPPEPHVHVPETVLPGGGPETDDADGADDENSAGPAWVEPDDGECPPTHPVKAKTGSRIFHVPGGANYARTRADRCYRDAGAAEADGFRPSKH
jgi:hypothetical protein